MAEITEHHQDSKFAEDAKKRLSRISGQVNGIQKMVDDGRYCVDILTQLSALRAALDQFGVILISEHLENCVYGNHGNEAETSGPYSSPQERVDELKTTLNRFLK